MKMVWKFLKSCWKFDWREATLDIASTLETFSWFTLGVIGGAWLVNDDASLLAIVQEHGQQMFLFWFSISFGFSLLTQLLEKWLTPKKEIPIG